MKRTRRNFHNGAQSGHSKNVLALLEAACPKNGIKPETPEEWRNLAAASEALAFAMYREVGMDEEQARGLVKATHGGENGLLLLRLAFGEGAS